MLATAALPTPELTRGPGSEAAVHTLQENYGMLPLTAATWKKPRKPLSPLAISSPETPSSQSVSPARRLSLSGSHLTLMPRGELLFFHLKGCEGRWRKGCGGGGVPPPGSDVHRSSILDSFSTLPPFCLYTLPLCCSPQSFLE